MPSTPTTIEDLQKLSESTERMIAELTGRPRLGEPSPLRLSVVNGRVHRQEVPRYIGPECLKFLIPPEA